jgi:hypothetical protein
MADSPITPPPELVRQWLLEYYGGDLGEVSPEEMYVARCAAQWGADQELEACCEWLKAKHWIEPEFADELRAVRRPKPPSLKEQALALLQVEHGLNVEDLDLLRRALEQLDG